MSLTAYICAATVRLGDTVSLVGVGEVAKRPPTLFLVLLLFYIDYAALLITLCLSFCYYAFYFRTPSLIWTLPLLLNFDESSKGSFNWDSTLRTFWSSPTPLILSSTDPVGMIGFGVLERDYFYSLDYLTGIKLSKSLFISLFDGGLHLFIWSFFCHSLITEARKPYPNRWFYCVADESLDERTLLSMCITEGLVGWILDLWPGDAGVVGDVYLVICVGELFATLFGSSYFLCGANIISRTSSLSSLSVSSDNNFLSASTSSTCF